ncbi:MAG: FtsX-like permease family protein [Longicatena sp.]
MYFKLALRNVRKSYKDFLVYFLTLAFSVCLFYTFNSFQSQQAVMDLNESQRMIMLSLSLILNMVSVFVVIVLGLLILYANNFLIKRRKKEFGLYMLLGMPKGKIATVLVYETLLIGVVSLVVGMFAGLLISQVLCALTASLFAVPLDYSFVFSPAATVLTLASFSSIFLITMIFNSFILNHYKLIDLINADRKNAELKIKKVWISIFIFILSLACIGWAYYSGISQGIEAFNNLTPIIIIGSIGTFLFFLSLAGFLLTILKSNKRIYYRNLNCFVLRQINSNINMNFLSMSVVCIMLLLSIGALSTGLSLNDTFNKAIKDSTPYDYTYKQEKYWPNGSEQNKDIHNFTSLVKDFKIDESLIQSQSFLKTYSADVPMDDPTLLNCIKDNMLHDTMAMNGNTKIMVTPLSSFNEIRKIRGYSPIELSDSGIYAYTSTTFSDKGMRELLDAKPTINLYGKALTIENSSFQPLPLGTSPDINAHILSFVVADKNIPTNADLYAMYWNVNVSDKTTPTKFSKLVDSAWDSYYTKINPNSHEYQIGTSKDDVYDMNKGMSVTCIYIGIYLGTVFLIASAVILALQQLSQANDNKKRYTILSKIGTEKRMMNHSILLQIAIYFLLPLALAIVHSIVGIKIVNTAVLFFGKADLMLSSLVTAGIIIIVYGSYFLVTYMGYKNIIKS